MLSVHHFKEFRFFTVLNPFCQVSLLIALLEVITAILCAVIAIGQHFSLGREQQATAIPTFQKKNNTTHACFSKVNFKLRSVVGFIAQPKPCSKEQQNRTEQDQPVDTF